MKNKSLKKKKSNIYPQFVAHDGTIFRTMKEWKEYLDKHPEEIPF
tara:strand:- start:182 stop:316 length:135 start_codon:yes stop_codon:yes gene_type:complete